MIIKKLKKYKLSLVTLGCNKNQTDSEFLLAGLSRKFEITGVLEEADIIVLSPCAFLEESRQEAKEYIDDLVKYKCKCFVITGCYSELLKNEVFLDNKNIDMVIGLIDIETFANAVYDFITKKEKNKIFIEGNRNVYGLFDDDIERISSHPNYSYVKISDGCNNRCSYCLIPDIRGEYKSRKKEIILNEVKALLDQGIKEINIISQDIGAYGVDIYKKKYLHELLESIADIKSDFWLRLLYMHPKHIDKELVELIKSKKNICKYIDMPIQHINDKILKSMNRKITKSEILEKILLLKKEIPDVIIRTTLILGFPGEGEEEFIELCDFVKNGYFDRVGVFSYSREKGTPSYDLPDQVSEELKFARAQKIMDIQEKISLKNNKKFIGKTFDVLPEEIVDEKTIKGRIFSMAPEVDGNVFVEFTGAFDFNDFLKVKIDSCDSFDLYGSLSNEFSK